jgi:uncharacterized protein (TIGR02118 family)
MIKVVYLVRRAPGLTHEEFVHHLLERHVPLALRHHPRLRKYTSAPVMAGTSNPDSIDSVAELYFDSLQDATEGLFDSEEGRRVIAEDVRRFCVPGSRRYITQELVFKDDIGTSLYRPGLPVAPLGGAVLPGGGW